MCETEGDLESYAGIHKVFYLAFETMSRVYKHSKVWDFRLGDGEA